MAEIKWRMTEGPLEVSIIESVEERFGVIFPEDYKACVKLHNGGYPHPDSFGGEDGDSMVFNNLISFTSSYLNMGMFVSEFKENRVLPFAKDPFGNHICFDYRYTDQNPTVVFWDHEEGEDFFEPVCESFTTLLEQLAANENTGDFDGGTEDNSDESLEASDAGEASELESPLDPAVPKHNADFCSKASSMPLEPGSKGAVTDDSFEVTFDPTSEEEIQVFETRHGFTLPEEYKAFLLVHNGGKRGLRRFETKDKKIETSVIMFLPLLNGNDWKNLEDSYRKFITGRIVPDHFLPIGTDPRNSLICIVVHGPERGQIFFCDLEYLEEDHRLLPSCIMPVSNSFKEFYNSLFTSE
jgi:cell wall assembly regulator SMI1